MRRIISEGVIFAVLSAALLFGLVTLGPAAWSQAVPPAAQVPQVPSDPHPEVSAKTIAAQAALIALRESELRAFDQDARAARARREAEWQASFAAWCGDRVACGLPTPAPAAVSPTPEPPAAEPAPK